MRVLILSDIHANFAALQAVVADAARYACDAVWCLGDLVGYGPEPNECVDLVREMNPVGVVGNHDWAVLGRMEVNDFNPEARRAVLWTREYLSPANTAWLSRLPSWPLAQGDFTLTHGSPRDPVWEYIHTPSAAQHNIGHFDTRFCLVGHTHVPALFFQRADGDRVRSLTPVSGVAMMLDDEHRVILNPGSVGQPRDNDPRAAYAILDTAELTWVSRRVSYPIEVTQAHMRTARLPERLINRLSFGW
jgi:diadenosine tetraphosphatase ApaH/serine/threonine PP2A family protein phosphatase